MRMHYKHPKDNIVHVIHEEGLKELMFLILASKLAHPKGGGHCEHRTTQGIALKWYSIHK